MSRFGWMGVGPLVLLVVWYCAHATGLVTPKLLPSPYQTLQSIIVNVSDGGLGQDFWATLRRTLQAFLIATAVGVPVGVMIGSNERVYRAIEFVVDFFRSTPATAMFPLAMIIFGLGDTSKVAIAAFAAQLIILFNVAYGVMGARPTRRLAAKIMGASTLRVFKDVTFFECLPQMLVGLRTSVSMALVVIVVAEMFIGSDNGLGKRVIDSQITFDMPQLYGTIFVAGFMGYGLNVVFLGLEKGLVHWSGR